MRTPRATNRITRNASLPLPLGTQSNQRAELMAIMVALDRASVCQDVLICSDSIYALRCTREWRLKRLLERWKDVEGKCKDSDEIVAKITERVRQRSSVAAETEFDWVRGHSGTAGNEAADRLARAGARYGGAMISPVFADIA